MVSNFANYGKHYAGGRLKSPPAVRLTAGGYHKSTPAQWFAKICKFEILA
jgi:hypothetical protein